jgi:hypothetical protein
MLILARKKRPMDEKLANTHFEIESLGWRSHIFVFIAAFTIVVVRKPDIILNPQFWAEDGAVWYAAAYNHGVLHSILQPWAGYFQTISRLVAAFSLIFPLSLAPLIFIVFAIIIKLLPVHLLLSSRFAAQIPRMSARLFMAFLYLGIPNSWETHANLTNAQWYLALLAFMVIVAAPGLGFLWRCFDIGVMLLSGLSGPFSIFLTPIAAFLWWMRRDKTLPSFVLLLSACASIQLICIFLTMHSHLNAPLGATPELFVNILSGQVFLGALIGQRGYEMTFSHSGWFTLLSLSVSLMGVALIAHAFLKAPVELRLFIVFAAIIFGAALITPRVSCSGEPQWALLCRPGNAGRYCLIPILAFIAVIVWMLGTAGRSRLLAVALTTIMCIGITWDWHVPPFADFDFKKYAHQFEQSSRGYRISIPINPPGWSMTLTKH